MWLVANQTPSPDTPARRLGHAHEDSTLSDKRHLNDSPVRAPRPATSVVAAVASTRDSEIIFVLHSQSSPESQNCGVRGAADLDVDDAGAAMLLTRPRTRSLRHLLNKSGPISRSTPKQLALRPEVDYSPRTMHEQRVNQAYFASRGDFRLPFVAVRLLGLLFILLLPARRRALT